MKTYLRHKVLNVVDIKELTAIEYLDFEGKYKEYVEKHDFWEMCYVEKGDVILTIEGEKCSLSANDAILIPPDSIHSYFSESGNESRAFVICFECLSQPLKSLSGAKFNLTGTAYQCMKLIINEYRHTFSTNENEQLEILENPNFGGQQAIIIQLEYLFICLLRMLSTEKNPEVVFLNEEHFYQDLVEVIINYFKENIDKKISLEELCDKVNYSRSFLCKTFKEQTGETLFSYFNRLKIDEAKRLLKKTEFTVTQISELLGFSEVKYFGASFKKFVGKSPTEYRSKNK